MQTILQISLSLSPLCNPPMVAPHTHLPLSMLPLLQLFAAPSFNLYETILTLLSAVPPFLGIPSSDLELKWPRQYDSEQLRKLLNRLFQEINGQFHALKDGQNKTHNLLAAFQKRSLKSRPEFQNTSSDPDVYGQHWDPSPESLPTQPCRIPRVLKPHFHGLSCAHGPQLPLEERS